MYNLSTLLEDGAARYPDRTAIVLGDTRLTYEQVNAFSNMVANLLVDRGIEPGDKVALSCPNLPYFTIVYFGILKAGAHRRPPQRAAQGPRGRLPPRRLRRDGLLLLRGHPRAADRRRGVRRLRGHRRLRALLPHHRRPRRAVADRGRRDDGAGDRRAARRPSRPSRPTRTTRRSSSTPPARPGSPRAPSCGTATCATTRCRARRSSAPTPTTPTPTSACCRSSTPSARPSSRTAPSPTAAPS